EQRIELPDALAAPEEQHAAIAQSEMKALEYLRLKVGTEVDEHVSTGNQIDSQERRIVDQVVAREHDHVAQPLACFPGAVEGLEVAFEQGAGQGFQRRRRVQAATRNNERIVVDVGGEDLHLGRNFHIRQRLVDQDAQRVGLFAACTA